MNKNCIIGLAIITIVMVVAFFVLPTPFLSVSMSAEHYYEGEPVDYGFPFAFVRDGVKVDELRVTVEWTATGVDVDMETLTLTGSIDIYFVYQVGQRAGEEELIDSQPIAGTKPDWFSTSSWMLNDILEFSEDNIANGWTLHIYGSLVAEVTDNYDNQLSESWSDDFTVGYSWEDSSGSLNLDASFI